MLTIKNLTIKYGDKAVIRNLDLDLQVGQIHGLVGLNGSGKSTLLRTLYGLKKQTEGKVELNGTTFNKKIIGFLETENFFYSRITGYEFLKLFQQKNKKFIIEEWNELFELPLHSLIETYSTGMRKKLAFLSIICLNKPFLIMDEPFNGIDLETSQLIKTVIKELIAQGRTLIITSHILETLTSICDTISYLKEGQIQFTIPKEEFTDLEHRIFHELDAENEKRVKSLFRN